MIKIRNSEFELGDHGACQHQRSENEDGEYGWTVADLGEAIVQATLLAILAEGER